MSEFGPKVSREQGDLHTSFTPEKQAQNKHEAQVDRAASILRTYNLEDPKQIAEARQELAAEGVTVGSVTDEQLKEFASETQTEFENIKLRRESEQAVPNKINELNKAGSGSVRRGAESVADLTLNDQFRRPDGTYMSKAEIASLALHEDEIRESLPQRAQEIQQEQQRQAIEAAQQEVARIEGVLDDDAALVQLASERGVKLSELVNQLQRERTAAQEKLDKLTPVVIDAKQNNELLKNPEALKAAAERMGISPEDLAAQLKGGDLAAAALAVKQPGKAGFVQRIKASIAEKQAARTAKRGEKKNGLIDFAKAQGARIAAAAQNFSQAFYKIDRKNFETDDAYNKARQTRRGFALASGAALGMTLLSASAPFVPALRLAGTAEAFDGGDSANGGLDTLGLDGDDAESAIDQEPSGAEVLDGFEGHEIGDPIEYNIDEDPFFAENKSSDHAFGESLADMSDGDLSQERAESVYDELQERWYDSPLQRAQMMAQLNMLPDGEGGVIEHPTDADVNRVADLMEGDPEFNGATFDSLRERTDDLDVRLRPITEAFDGGYIVNDNGDLVYVESRGVPPSGHVLEFVQPIYDDNGNQVGESVVATARIECGGQPVDTIIKTERLIPPPVEKEPEKTESEKEVEKEAEKTESEKEEEKTESEKEVEKVESEKEKEKTESEKEVEKTESEKEEEKTESEKEAEKTESEKESEKTESEKEVEKGDEKEYDGGVPTAPGIDPDQNTYNPETDDTPHPDESGNGTESPSMNSDEGLERPGDEPTPISPETVPPAEEGVNGDSGFNRTEEDRAAREAQEQAIRDQQAANEAAAAQEEAMAEPGAVEEAVAEEQASIGPDGRPIEQNGN